MELVISVKQHVLHGEQGVKARAAATSFFKAANVTPLEAARASWELEGALEFNQDYLVDEESCRRAEVWAEVNVAVASVLAVPASDVDVALAIEGS
jgi:hypothetical protein